MALFETLCHCEDGLPGLRSSSQAWLLNLLPANVDVEFSAIFLLLSLPSCCCPSSHDNNEPTPLFSFIRVDVYCMLSTVTKMFEL